MFCRKCGAPNDDNAYKCTKCGDVLQGLAAPRVENHLVLAIIVTILCCLPFGIVGIVYAAQVNALAQGGNLAAAQESADKARKWSLWGLALGVVVYGLYGLMMLAGTMTELTP